MLTFLLPVPPPRCRPVVAAAATGQEVGGVGAQVAADGRLLQAAQVPDVLRAIDQQPAIRGRRREPPQRLRGRDVHVYNLP